MGGRAVSALSGNAKADPGRASALIDHGTLRAPILDPPRSEVNSRPHTLQGVVVDGYEIRPVRTRDEREACASVALEVTPEHARTADESEYDDGLPGGAVRLVAWRSGEPVAYGASGRIHHYAPSFDGRTLELAVRAGHRGRGLGSALYAQLSLAARAVGKHALHAVAGETDGEAVAWLERRSFREWERTRRVELELTTAVTTAAAASEPAPGIEIVTLAGRPDLLADVHALASEAFEDIPGSDEAHAAGSFEAWVARAVEAPGIPRDGFFVALAGGRVAGYASLEIPGAHPRIAWHDMTAVARAERGRGIASALKRATIAWAAAAGLERLQTENNVDNAAMRAVNARLGYQPLPDEIALRGPLAHAAPA